MRQVGENASCEKRIDDEIFVDANGPEEQAMGRYYYLQNTIHSPFTAHCIAERSTSVLRVGDEIIVLGMGPTSECEHEMLVEMRRENLIDDTNRVRMIGFDPLAGFVADKLPKSSNPLSDVYLFAL